MENALKTYKFKFASKSDEEIKKIINKLSCDQLNHLIFLSAGNSYIFNIKAFIIAKIDLNIRNASGETPIMVAAYYGNEEIVKLLIEYGVDLNIKCNYGKTALMHALGGQIGTHQKIVNMLINGNSSKFKF